MWFACIEYFVGWADGTAGSSKSVESNQPLRKVKSIKNLPVPRMGFGVSVGNDNASIPTFTAEKRAA